jgi:hypothetical protein
VRLALGEAAIWQPWVSPTGTACRVDGVRGAQQRCKPGSRSSVELGQPVAQGRARGNGEKESKTGRRVVESEGSAQRGQSFASQP